MTPLRRLPGPVRLQIYRDGILVHRWGLRPTIRRMRGLCLGLSVEWEPGPHRESPATHGRVRVRCLLWVFTVEHLSTIVRGAKLPGEGHQGS